MLHTDRGPDASRTPRPDLLGCLTRHAHQRLAGRAIPLSVVEWLIDLGQRVHVGQGVEVVRFHGHSRRLVKRAIGPKAYANLERTLSTAYAVVACDGTIITVGHLTRRVHHH